MEQEHGVYDIPKVLREQYGLIQLNMTLPKTCRKDTATITEATHLIGWNELALKLSHNHTYSAFTAVLGRTKSMAIALYDQSVVTPSPKVIVKSPYGTVLYKGTIDQSTSSAELLILVCSSLYKELSPASQYLQWSIESSHGGKVVQRTWNATRPPYHFHLVANQPIELIMHAKK